jgi:iron complex outermembrane receptor protein
VAQEAQPVTIIDRDAINKTGLANVGDLLQRLSTSGKALNAKFNSSGNFGYPPDGGGIGAGSAQVDLRNLESKRVLVLVDGLRWVNESSASGVSGSSDLNTIPLSIVDHIEVLEDGASAIYGSDAIAGVVNVITRKSSMESRSAATTESGARAAGPLREA